MAQKTNTPEEIEFLLDACAVMQELNDMFKEIGRGEDEQSKAVDETIRKIRASIKKQVN